MSSVQRNLVKTRFAKSFQVKQIGNIQWSHSELTTMNATKEALFGQIRLKKYTWIFTGKWLRTSSSVVINLVPSGLSLLKKLLADFQVYFRMFFSKNIDTDWVSYILDKNSPFNNSWRKEIFEKIYVLFWRKNIFQTSKDVSELLIEIKLKRYCWYKCL